MKLYFQNIDNNECIKIEEINKNKKGKTLYEEMVERGEFNVPDIKEDTEGEENDS